jgi:cell division protein FtsB
METKLDELHDMMKVLMNKFNRLELIEEPIKKVVDGFNDLKNSIDFAHAEVVDLKEDNKVQKIKGEEIRARIEKLEQENTALNNSVIDLKARSMRDNLIFYNIEETERENTTEKVHGLLEEKMGFKDAATKIKIDRSHRIGRARRDEKPRPIVVKFNWQIWHQDKEQIRFNAKKLAGSNIGVSEQYPEEINAIRKKLYPVYKEARRNIKKKATLVRDRLFIDGKEFKL